MNRYQKEEEKGNRSKRVVQWHLEVLPARALVQVGTLRKWFFLIRGGFEQH